MDCLRVYYRKPFGEAYIRETKIIPYPKKGEQKFQKIREALLDVFSDKNAGSKNILAVVMYPGYPTDDDADMWKVTANIESLEIKEEGND